jgi:tetratricopeptide (TPR) repeat protein
MRNLNVSAPKEVISQLFDTIDRDGSGAFEYNELYKALKGPLPLPQAPPRTPPKADEEEDVAATLERRADEVFERKEYEKAEQLYTQAIDASLEAPPRLFVRRCAVRACLGKLKSALADAERAVALQSSARSHACRGDVLLLMINAGQAPDEEDATATAGAGAGTWWAETAPTLFREAHASFRTALELRPMDKAAGAMKDELERLADARLISAMKAREAERVREAIECVGSTASVPQLRAAEQACADLLTEDLHDRGSLSGSLSDSDSLSEARRVCQLATDI